jgi:ribosomal protein S27AE
MAEEDIRVRCAKCGDIHMESERPKRSEEELETKRATPLLCPRCGHDTWEHA